MSRDLCTAHPIAPEDIQKGQYLVTLYRVEEHLPMFCGEEDVYRRGEPYRVRWLPEVWEIGPMKVRAVCLPFVMVKNAAGAVYPLDVRRCTFAAVPAEFATAIVKSYRAMRKNRERGEAGG